jgi:hypothetical protein
MAHQDRGRGRSECLHADDLHTAWRWLATGMSFASIALRSDCTWTAQALTFAGLLWAWSDERTLKERFEIARKITIFLQDDQQDPADTYQAFVKLLKKWTASLVELLAVAFRQRMPQVLDKVWTVAGWVVFAVDGSKLDVPRTIGNEERYSPQSKLARKAQKRHAKGRRTARRRSRQEANARKANVPRIFLTTLWHVGSGLPWAWRTGPSDSSERAHLLEMLSTLPAAALIAADAGFVGYEFWKAVLDSNRQLLVRVGSNVKLLKQLGYARECNGIVYLWPDKAMRKCLPPLVLRLVVVSQGRHPVHLVTSVLSRQELSDKQVGAVYRRRWGIELYYRQCKQTFDRGKLRSRNPDNAMVELHWSLLGMWAMGLHSHAHLLKQEIPPERMSFAGIWRAYRRPMREYKSHPDPGECMTEILDRAVIDPYHRKNKASRDYPRQKQERPAGPPIIQKATRKQIKQARCVKLLQEKG